MMCDGSSRIALIGANGMLAAMVRDKASSHYEVVPLDLPDFDLTDRDRVLDDLERIRPEIIINCAAFTDVDGCETKEALATRVNGDGPGYLAEAALASGATLVHISTDYVFDGVKSTPYLETDPTNPRSAYGRSKLLGEQAVIESGLEKYFIVRTSWLYGPQGKNFVETIIRLAREREELRVVADQIGSPTFTGDLAAAIFRLLKTQSVQGASGTFHDLYGIYHFANAGVCSWHEFAEQIVRNLEQSGESLSVRKVSAITTEEFPLPAPRPAYSVLSTEKFRDATGETVPHWRDGLKRYFGIRRD